MDYWYKLSTLFLIVLFLIEIVINQKEKKDLYKRKDTFQNILIGGGLVLAMFLSRMFVIPCYYLTYSFRICTIDNTWVTWIAAFVITDLCYYVYHRSCHSINWFWVAHSVHHSSQEFNISLSFRISWLVHISGEFLFWVWLPIIGFDPLVILICFQLCSLYQSWLHTELIKKLHPLFEWIFNTPSHHRVHHSSEVKYLDKNHGAVLIIWDRIFGTYQEEENSKTTYGLTNKQVTDDVSTILFSDWKMLFTKIRTAGSIINGINYIIQPPGWSHDGSSLTVKQLRNI